MKTTNPRTTAMTLGTAKITTRNGHFIVTWMNVGNFLRCEPRAFRTETQAREFCRVRGLRIVTGGTVTSGDTNRRHPTLTRGG
jgi:hypothetical protein